MSEKIKYARTKALLKIINGNRVYLRKSWDLVHGNGWFFVQIIQSKTFHIGNGFHKRNKITAYKNAILSLQE